MAPAVAGVRGQRGRWGRPVIAARIEIRAYIDGWTHCYQAEDLESGCELVTPGCAEIAAFHAVDHERSQVSAPVERAGRIEFCPGCLTWARKRATPGPVPVRRGHAEPDTFVMPALAGVIRGVL